jgi:hypothetical protein
MSTIPLTAPASSEIDVSPHEPVPELGPAMRALAKGRDGALYTKGNRSAALRLAGYGAKTPSMRVMASRMFADPRMRAAIREVASHMIETAEPELTTGNHLVRSRGARPAPNIEQILCSIFCTVW